MALMTVLGVFDYTCPAPVMMECSTVAVFFVFNFAAISAHVYLCCCIASEKQKGARVECST